MPETPTDDTAMSDPFLRRAREGCPVCSGRGEILRTGGRETDRFACPECARVTALLRQQAAESREKALDDAIRVIPPFWGGPAVDAIRDLKEQP